MNIKEAIRSSGIKQWRICETLNISEFQFSRMLRHPERISNEMQNKIYMAIEELKQNKIGD